MKTLYSLKDITIIPSVISSINSRKECILPDKLPLFVAPMSSIINFSNYLTFNKKVYPIIPRSVNIEKRINSFIETTTNVAFSLNEIKEYDLVLKHFITNDLGILCIDIANGHMQQLLPIIEDFSKVVTVMVGNVANPETYVELSQAGASYVRVGIGGGNVCTTSANSGVHYPMASLIQECKQLKDKYNLTTKIVADGGMDNFDDIIKALALGADYVMLGKLFAQTVEACGKAYDDNNKLHVHSKVGLLREYYGMSTKQAQKECNISELRTAEGIHKLVPISYTLDQWIDNFKHYLKTAMSYCNSHNLDEFRSNVQFGLLTPASRNAFFK